MSKIDLPPDNTHNRLNFLLGELNRVVKPGSIIALITDFIGVDEQSLELLSSIVKHNDVNAYWIHDDTEIKPWPSGHYQVLVNQQKVGFDLSGSSSDTWLSQWQQEHRHRIETLASGLNIPLLPVSCNYAITPQILNKLSI